MVGDDQTRHVSERGRPKRIFNGAIEKGCAVDQEALDVTFALTPNLAEQDQMAAIEQAELVRVDLAFERANAAVAERLCFTCRLRLIDRIGRRQRNLFDPARADIQVAAVFVSQ